uniref:Uncharacterized protein n=1 Tax=Arundo donax TaxID=35708 RepID=A0A0A9HSF4_ARUDO
MSSIVEAILLENAYSVKAKFWRPYCCPTSSIVIGGSSI